MIDGGLLWVVNLLAVAGLLALLYRIAGESFRFILLAGEETAARRLAEVSARQGDLTSMTERRRTAERARRVRRRVLLLVFGWALWLMAPPMFGWSREAYALAAVLWMLPYGRPEPARKGETVDRSA